MDELRRAPAELQPGLEVGQHLFTAPDVGDLLQRGVVLVAAALRVGGLVVCEEPVRYHCDDPVFARYDAAVTAVVAARGATLWAGPALDRDPPHCRRVIDRVVEHPVPAARAAAMFWRNATTWGGETDLVDALRAIDGANRPDPVLWELRQTVWAKTGE